MPCEDIFTSIEPCKNPTTMGDALVLIHHSIEEDPFKGRKEEVINIFLTIHWRACPRSVFH